MEEIVPIRNWNQIYRVTILNFYYFLQWVTIPTKKIKNSLNLSPIIKETISWNKWWRPLSCQANPPFCLCPTPMRTISNIRVTLSTTTSRSQPRTPRRSLFSSTGSMASEEIQAILQSISPRHFLASTSTRLTSSTMENQVESAEATYIHTISLLNKPKPLSSIFWKNSKKNLKSSWLDRV